MDDARRTFLTELIDDAGLFPPASMPMEDAVAQHVASRSGPFAWMLARFICPSSRLPELAKALPEDEAADSWRISAILDGGEAWREALPTSLLEVQAFAEEAGARSAVEILEAPLPAAADPGLAGAFAGALAASGLSAFVELPADADPGPLVEAIARADGDVGAKLRCGGASADRFPSPARVATFVDACRAHAVRFKCTAGLHHPFRHVDRATGHTQHGFVNLVGATVLAMARDLDAEAIEAVVADEDPASFSLTAEGLSWRHLEASPADIAAARGALFVAYGSCSFDEPVEDLLALGVLPA